MANIINRRAALGRIVATAFLALPAAAIAAVPSDPDAEIISLSAEIIRRAGEAASLKAQVDPLHDRFVDMLRDEAVPWEQRRVEGRAYSQESGHEALVEQLEKFENATDTLFKRMMAIPASTQPGRAAKVRTLIVHVMRGDWRGKANNLDWDVEMARALLGEFAGLSAEQLDLI